MANSTISALPSAASVSLSDVIPADQGGISTVNESLSQIMDLYGENIQIASTSQISGFSQVGSFTPTMIIGGVESSGVVYATQLGQFTKISNMVTIYLKMTLTSKGTSTGYIAVGGLPFNSGSNQALFGTIFTQFLTYHGNQQVFGYSLAGNNVIGLIYGTSGGTDTLYQNTDIADNFDIIISGTYFTT